MQLSNAIRQRIINLSKPKNYNLAELSRQSNVKYSTLVSFMVGDTKTLTLNTLYKICLGLDIDLIDFFDDNLFIDTVDEHEKNFKK